MARTRQGSLNRETENCRSDKTRKKAPKPVRLRGFHNNQINLDDIGLEGLKNRVSALLGVNVELDGLAQVQGKDAHDGLGVNNITTGYQVEVIVETGNIIDEGLNFIDRIL